MSTPNSKKQVIAKLISARGEIEDALRLSAPGARYDPIVIPSAARAEMTVLLDKLGKIIREFEGEQYVSVF